MADEDEAREVDCQGRRLPNHTPLDAFKPGDYAFTEGAWWALTPDNVPLTLRPVSVHSDKRISAQAGPWRLQQGDWYQE